MDSLGVNIIMNTNLNIGAARTRLWNYKRRNRWRNTKIKEGRLENTQLSKSTTKNTTVPRSPRGL